MAGVNKAILVGNLGRDPEVRYTPNGLAVANFNIATSETFTNKSGERETRTEWHRIVAFGKLGEICGEYLAKGRQVYIEGRIQTRDWEDKDGIRRYTTEIVASQMQMLGTKESAGTGKQSFDTRDSGDTRDTGMQENMPGPPFPENQDDDIPF